VTTLYRWRGDELAKYTVIRETEGALIVRDKYGWKNTVPKSAIGKGTWFESMEDINRYRIKHAKARIEKLQREISDEESKIMKWEAEL